MMLSKNPYSGEVLKEHQELSSKEINISLDKGVKAFQDWKRTDFTYRSRLINNVAQELRKNKREYARSISLEMGKPITQALSEVEKCAWVCEYYAENASGHLAPEQIKTDGVRSYVRFAPLGLILAIMPWNYPFWQVFRFAVPALMAGNTAVLKHASNVMICAGNIESIFLRAGFPEGCFQNLLIGSDKVEQVIDDDRVMAVTLTGSTAAGSAVASRAGKKIKKTVMELGGSNALVVFDDADLEQTVEKAIQARFQNTGQSCIAGKRLLVHQDIAADFTELFRSRVKDLKTGDPMDDETYIGVLAKDSLAQSLEKQVTRSKEQGAKIILGGGRNGAFYQPAILTEVTKKMPVFQEETFGPAIGITTFKGETEALQLANATKFGLGVSLFTSLERAEKLVPEFQDGAVFLNEIVKSDPRLPFGGTKASGYGRELSSFGIREFINIQTVYLNQF